LFYELDEGMIHNYIVSHKDFCEYETNYSKVIWVGPIGEGKTINDRGTDSIWRKNSSYCELTALHKIWKSLAEDELQIGFSHYRRQLLLKKMVNEEKLLGHYSKTAIIPVGKVSSGGLVCLDVDELKNLSEFDVVLPFEENIQESVKQHFLHKHGSKSWDLMIGVLERNGEEEVVECLLDDQNQRSRWGNLFLLQKRFLKDFCQWLFPLLEEMERGAKQVPEFNDERIYGFLAERMFSAYFSRLIRERSDLKLLERPTLLIDFENQELWNRISELRPDERFWIWGAGSFGEKFLNGLRLMGLEDRVLGFIDSSPGKQSQTFSSFAVVSQEFFFDREKQSNHTFIVVASSGWTQISNELKSQGRKKSVDYYCLQGFS